MPLMPGSAAARALGFEGPEEELVRTEVQQPAILTTSIALLRALEEHEEVSPAFYAGHSLGEYSALVAAGALGFEDAVRLVQARGRFMQEAVPEGRGAMAAVLGLDPASVADACVRSLADRPRRGPATFTPQQDGISGFPRGRGAWRAALERGAGGRSARSLAPFPGALMLPAAENLRGAARFVSAPRGAFVTNVEATLVGLVAFFRASGAEVRLRSASPN